MVRVPLPFRGVAVLLLAVATATGQTPEPPTELLSLDPVAPSPPEILRQFASDPRHPLLSLMVDGELTAFEETAPPDSAKLKPTPQKKSSAAPKALADDECVLDGGSLDGCSLDGCALESDCLTIPNCLPFACSSPAHQGCGCRKCQRQRKHGHGHSRRHGCGSGNGCGNPYLDWPTCPAWCFYGAALEPDSSRCHGRRCCRRHSRRHQDCDDNFTVGWGMDDCGSWNSGFCGDCMPQQQQHSCRRCQRRQRCSGHGNQGWNGYCGMSEGCYGCGYPYSGYNQGCGHHSRRSRRHRCHGGNQQAPYYAYPMMSPCMGDGFSYMGDGASGEDWSYGNDFGLGQDAIVLDSGN